MIAAGVGDPDAERAGSGVERREVETEVAASYLAVEYGVGSELGDDVFGAFDCLGWEAPDSELLGGEQPGEAGAASGGRKQLRERAQRDVPLRDRNGLLLPAGYAPAYREDPLGSDRMTVVRSALKTMLAGHDPYPAAAIDRIQDIVDLQPCRVRTAQHPAAAPDGLGRERDAADPPRYFLRGPETGLLASGPGMTVAPCRSDDLGGGVTGSGAPSDR